MKLTFVVPTMVLWNNFSEIEIILMKLKKESESCDSRDKTGPVDKETFECKLLSVQI